MKPLQTTAIVLIGLVIGLSDCADVDVDEGIFDDQESEHNLTFRENNILGHAMHEIEKRFQESPRSLEYRDISHFTQLSRDTSEYSPLHFSVFANFVRKPNQCTDDQGCPTEPIANSHYNVEVKQLFDGSGVLVGLTPVFPNLKDTFPTAREYEIVNQMLPEISRRLNEESVVYRNISNFTELPEAVDGGYRFSFNADFERKITGQYFDHMQTGINVRYEPINYSQHEIEVQLCIDGGVALNKFIRSNDNSFNDHPTINPNVHPTNAPNVHPNPEELSMLAEVLHCIQHRLKWNRSVRYRNISHFKQLPENRQTGRHFSVVANFERPATCKLDRVPNCIYEPMPNSEYILEVQQNTTLRGDNEYIPMGTNIRSLELRK